MSEAKNAQRLCPRHKHCGHTISAKSKAKYCSKCQYQLFSWIESNEWLDSFSNEDIFFIFEHPAGCTKSGLALYLSLSGTRLGAFQRDTGLSNEFDYRQMVKIIQRIRKIETLTKFFLEYDLVFIKDHLNGCLVKELCQHLTISTTTFNVYIRTGKVKLERKWRIGKEVFKLVSFQEMIRIINLKNNWISLYQVAKTEGKRYFTLQHYTQDGYFGKLGYNLEGLLSIRRSILANFAQRWQKATIDHKENQIQSRRRLLGNDEVHLGIIIEWLKTSSEGHLWQFVDKGWLKGTPRNGMCVVKISDLKKFLLKVANGEYPVQRHLLGKWENSPLGKDKAFFEEMCQFLQKNIPPEKQPAGNKHVQLGPNTLIVEQVADIFSSKSSTVRWWFARKTIVSYKKDGIYYTTLSDVKQLIRDILNKKCRIQKSAALKAMDHPMILLDQAFALEIRQML